MPRKIQLRRDTAANFTAANPILLRGEPAFETDTKTLKIGDGTTAYTSLPAASLSEIGVAALIAEHADRTDNPHQVTKEQVGLGNVSNLAPANLPISTATQSALDLKYDASNPSAYVDASGAAAAAPVQSVAGRTGAVTLAKSDVGLSNVDNVSAANLRDRSTHTGTQTSATISDFSTTVDARIELQKGDAGGLASLDSGGKVFASQLPATLMEFKGTWDASSNSPTLANGSSANAPEDAGHVFVVSVAGTVDFGAGAISFSSGDWVILNDSLIWEKSVNSNLVASVNGHQGVVVLAKSDIGLGNVSNLAPADLPISTATQSALDLKYDASNPSAYVNASGAAAAAPVQSVAGRTGAVTLSKTDVGLSAVPNVDATARSNHTGTQLAATISDFTTAVQAVTIDAAKIDGGVVSNAEFATLDGITTGVSIQSQIDGKQATITGGATTITSSNLTASRALASDSSGKVAVSATTASELGFVAGVTSAIQTQLDSKQATITGAATTITSSNLTASRALTSDSNGKVAVSTTTASEIGFVSGVTSSIQTQFSGKANLSGGNTFTGKQIATPSATDPGLNIGSISSDPSAPANGDVWYNSTTFDFKIRKNGVSSAVRSLIATQVLTTGTTYTPSAGALFIRAILIGAGGGGGAVTGAANSVGAGGGGGSGAMLEISTALTGAASYTISLGTAGAGGVAGNNSGSTGGSTTLTIGATTYTATGGVGGGGQAAGTAAAFVLGGNGATTPTGGTINLPGANGFYGTRTSGTVGVSGRGADSPFGAGGAAIIAAAAGTAASGYGAGGGGALSTTNVNRAGGNGSPGAIIVYEYA